MKYNWLKRRKEEIKQASRQNGKGKWEIKNIKTWKKRKERGRKE